MQRAHGCKGVVRGFTRSLSIASGFHNSCTATAAATGPAAPDLLQELASSVGSEYEASEEEFAASIAAGQLQQLHLEWEGEIAMYQLRFCRASTSAANSHSATALPEVSKLLYHCC